MAIKGPARSPRREAYWRRLVRGQPASSLSIRNKRCDRVKLFYEDGDGYEAEERLVYFQFYSHKQIHQARGYRTPAEVYRQRN